MLGGFPATNTVVPAAGPLGPRFDQLFADRIREAGAFYAAVIPETLAANAKGVMRQALAGLRWSKQFYHHGVKRWQGRNREWTHLYNEDVRPGLGSAELSPDRGPPASGARP